MPGIGIIVPVPGTGPIVPPALHPAGADGYNHRFVASRFVDLETLAVGDTVTSIPDYGSAPLTLSASNGTNVLAEESGQYFIDTVGHASNASADCFASPQVAPAAVVTIALVVRAPDSQARLFRSEGIRIDKAASGQFQFTRSGSFLASGTSGWCFLLVTLSAGAVRARVNAAETTGTFTDSPPALASVGMAGNNGATGRNVDVAEAIVWPRVLDATERAAVHAAMKAEYPVLP